MEVTSPLTWSSIAQHIETAALIPQQRDELLIQALHKTLVIIPAMGSAFIRPSSNGTTPWKLLYTGIREVQIRRLLSAHLDEQQPDALISNLQHDLSHLTDMPSPILISLQSSHLSSSGLWIIWPSLISPSQSFSPSPTGTILNDGIQHARHVLEAVLEVESKEDLYFLNGSPLIDRHLIEALAHGDTHALPALLSFTRMFGKADLVYWGQVRNEHVEVAGQVGAYNTGFGFEIPLGHGIGGRVATRGSLVEVSDYRNSPYRYPGVREIVDKEQVRSGVAIPVHDSTSQIGAVLYLTRRTVAPFSLADRLLVQRFTRSLEPLIQEDRSLSVSFPAIPQPLDRKAAWRDVVLHANHVETVEAWLAQVINGSAIVVDEQDRPYVLAHTEHLERLQATGKDDKGAAHVITLSAPGIKAPGRLYLWPTVPLPPADWLDFFADTVTACNVAISRMEQGHYNMTHQWERWLHTVLEQKSLQHADREGYRLGLPVEQGQVWVIAWAMEAAQVLKSPRMRMIVENVILDTLRSPLMLLEDIGVILLRGQPVQTLPTPSTVREELLRYLGPHPVWIVHGAFYHSFEELKETLIQAIKMARQARREKHEQYILDNYTFGLDSLLENPRLANDLEIFARRLLTPLIEYDAHTSSNLTETFVLMQTLGSLQSVAVRLGIHINTVRYRMHRAEHILGKDPASPKEHAALLLAAFIWTHLHSLEQKY